MLILLSMSIGKMGAFGFILGGTHGHTYIKHIKSKPIVDWTKINTYITFHVHGENEAGCIFGIQRDLLLIGIVSHLNDLYKFDVNIDFPDLCLNIFKLKRLKCITCSFIRSFL